MSAPPRFDAARDSRPITLQLSEKVFAGLEAMARKAGRSPTLQAQLLFDAAYAARCKPTGDRDLDEAVAGIDAPAPSSPKAVEALTEEWRGPAVTQGDPMLVAIEAMRCQGEVVMPHHAPALAIVAGLIAIQVEPDHAEKVDELAAAGAVQSPFPGPEDAGPRAVEADPAEPVVPAAGGGEAGPEGPSRPDRDAPDLSAVAASPPAATPPAAEPSGGQAKLIRQLKSIGNTPAEIADIMGLPADQVRAVLGQGRRR
jgi:hypothetical protein